jgi:hypothetical protein
MANITLNLKQVWDIVNWAHLTQEAPLVGSFDHNNIFIGLQHSNQFIKRYFTENN